MQNAVFADVARDCGLGAEHFGDEYAYTDHNGAYSLDHNQEMYGDDPISEFSGDLGKYMRHVKDLITVKPGRNHRILFSVPICTPTSCLGWARVPP